MGSAMRYQPQGAARPSPTIPLTRGLRFFGLPRNGLSPSACPVRSASSARLGGGLAFTAPGGASFSAPIPSVTSAEWTVACVAYSVSTTYSAAFEIYGSTSARIGLMIYGGNGGRFECDARPYAADFGGNTVLVPKNIPVVLGATISASKNQIRTFVDQTLAGSSGLTSTAPITVNQFNLFGKDGGGTDRSVAGNQIMLVAIWDRALSDTEWNAFSANPWQLFDAGSSSSAYQSAIATPTGAAPAGPNSFAYSALGGAVFGGSAPRVRSIARVPVGSLTMAGSGQAIRGAARAPQGGLAFSGASGIVRSIARAAAGGLKLAGTAAISATAQVQARVIMPVGGLLLAGASAISRVTSRAVSGGLKLSGHALAYTGALSTLLSGILPIFARRRRRQ